MERADGLELLRLGERARRGRRSIELGARNLTRDSAEIGI
jgi:hypothetical protein